MDETKFCKFCGAKIPMDAVLCTACGRQVEEFKSERSAQPSIVINNANANTNTNVNGGGAGGKAKNKTVAILLCLFLGLLGAHRFYEGKILSGILYLCTGGLCGVAHWWTLSFYSQSRIHTMCRRKQVCW